MREDRFCNQPQISSRIAVCSWALRAHSPAELIVRIRELQLSAVELDFNQIIDDEARWGDVIDHLRDAGIWVIGGMMTLRLASDRRLYNGTGFGGFATILSDEAWFPNRFLAEQVARVADRGCVSLVCTRLGSLPQDHTSPQWAKLADRLGALAEIFSNYGIHFALSPGQASVESLDKLMDELNLPNLGVFFDPADLVLAGAVDIVEPLQRLAQRVKLVHVRDAKPAKSSGNGGREVAAGLGSVPWPELLDVSNSIAPPVHYVIERDSRVVRDEDLIAARDLIAYHLTRRQELRH